MQATKNQYHPKEISIANITFYIQWNNYYLFSIVEPQNSSTLLWENVDRRILRL